MKTKRTWHYCTDKDIVSIYNNVWDYAISNYNEEIKKPLLYTAKSSTDLGRCVYSFKSEEKEFVIILNEKYLEDYYKPEAKATIIHEIGHVLTVNSFGIHSNHGYEWKTITKTIANKFNCPEANKVFADSGKLYEYLINKRKEKIINRSLKFNSLTGN